LNGEIFEEVDPVLTVGNAGDFVGDLEQMRARAVEQDRTQREVERDRRADDDDDEEGRVGERDPRPQRRESDRGLTL
jgi:hypothetical protein